MIPPNLWLNRRGPADLRVKREYFLAQREFIVNLEFVRGGDQPTRFLSHHFRTPSPCGQFRLILSGLPTSPLRKPLMRRCFAVTCGKKNLSLIHAVPMSKTEAIKNTEQQGSDKCTLRHGSLPSPHARDWWPVETRQENKRWLAQGQGQPQQLCWTVNPSPARLSARRGTCSTVRQTRVSVTERKALRFPDRLNVAARARSAWVLLAPIIQNKKRTDCTALGGLRSVTPAQMKGPLHVQ